MIDEDIQYLQHLDDQWDYIIYANIYSYSWY